MFYSLEKTIAPSKFFSMLKKNSSLNKKEIGLTDLILHPLFASINLQFEDIHFKSVLEYQTSNRPTNRIVLKGMMLELMFQSILLIQLSSVLKKKKVKDVESLLKILNMNPYTGNLMSCSLTSFRKGIFYEVKYQRENKGKKFIYRINFTKTFGRTEKIYFDIIVKTIDEFIDALFKVLNETLNVFPYAEQKNGRLILSKSFQEMRKGKSPTKLIKLITELFPHNRYYFTEDLPTNTYSLEIINEFIDRKKIK